MSFLSTFFLHKKDITCAISFLLILLSSFILLNTTGPFQTHLLPQQNNVAPSNNSSSTPSCDYSYGKWVWDENAPTRFYTEECLFLDPGFRCRRNGRLDTDYLNWRWQPHGCDLPRLNATSILEKSSNKRIVFAGDSIGRNQWESMVCVLAEGESNKSAIFEQNGNPITKHKGFLSIKFQTYNLTVEYYRVPFLVAIGRPPETGYDVKVNKAIRVDTLHWMSKRWIGADVIVFSAGHWWNEDKTIKMGYYFQEGEKLNMTMDVREAFHKTLETLKRWIITNLSPANTRVAFRSYSPVHFRGGDWNSGGRCELNTGPETNRTELEPEPWNNRVISETLEEIKNSTNVKVQLLNVTYLTELRKDGHPSSHREAASPSMPVVPSVQDCSHWCLPGVPDAWNEMLFAYLYS